MKGILEINGQRIEVEVNEQEFENLGIKKKTGYERAEYDQDYYMVTGRGEIEYFPEKREFFDQTVYETANYYSDKTVTENNARADKLMRQLRRFAVENRKTEFDWKNQHTTYYKIAYRHCLSTFFGISGLEASCSATLQDFGGIYFDSREVCEKAIETFKDELTWYFTEYKDSL